MKKIYLPILLCAALLGGLKANAAVIGTGNANVYAYDLNVVSNSEVSFKLNSVPTSVTLNFYKSGETAPVHTVELNADELAGIIAGTDVTVTLSDIAGVEKGEKLTWEVVAAGAAHDNILGVSDYAGKVAELSAGGTVTEAICTEAATSVADDQKMEYPYSVAVDNNPASPNFGNIYMLNMSDSDKAWGTATRGQGLLVYNPDLTLATETATEVLNQRIGYFNSSKSYFVPVAPYAVAVAEDGTVFVSNNSNPANNGGIYVASNDLTSFTKLIDVPSGQNFQDLVVVGTGAERAIYVLEENTMSLLKYVIGDMAAESYTAETVVKLSEATEAVSTTYTLNSFGSYPARLCSDKKGGFWAITGDRTSDVSGYFLLNHISADGVLDYYKSDYYGCYSGDYAATAKRFYDIDTNADGSELSIAICGSIIPFTVAWTDGVPALTENIYVKGANSATAPYGREGNSLNGVTTGVAYDVAGNIIATDLSGYFQAYALPSTNSYTTPANESIEVTDAVLTGIADVAVDADAPVEYYNLQGVKVANPENGIFVKKQGSKVVKVAL